MNTLKGSIALLQIISVGIILVFFIDREKTHLYYKLALSYIVGSIIFSWYLFLFSLVFSFYPSFSLTSLFILIIFIIFLIFSSRFREELEKFREKRELIKLLPFLVFLIYWEIWSLSVPLFNYYDELTQWGAKGVFLFYEKSPLIPPFLSEYFFHGHKKYPLLIPFLESWIHFSIGKVDFSVCKIIFPPYLFSLLIIIFEHLNRKIKNFLISVFVIILIISLNPIFIKSTSGYVDIPLACFYTFTLLMLLNWHENRKKIYLFYAGIGLMSLFFTKNEGYMFYVIILFLIILLFSYDLSKNKNFAFYNFVPILISLPFLCIWIKVSSGFAPSGENYFKYIKDPDYLFQNLNKIPLILKSWLKVFMNYRSWGGFGYFTLHFLFSFSFLTGNLSIGFTFLPLIFLSLGIS